MTDTTTGGAASTIYTTPLPTGFDPTSDDAGSVQDFLANKGVPVDWVAVGKKQITVAAEADPRSTLVSYQSSTDQRQRIKDQLSAIDVANGDLATVKQAVSLLIQLAVLP